MDTRQKGKTIAMRRSAGYQSSKNGKTSRLEIYRPLLVSRSNADREVRL
jgi:hypothetical protein